MGDEALCRAWIDGAEVKGKALLETDELIFRGEGRRYVIPLRSVTAATVESGRLSIAHASGIAVLDLERDAERWARKILNPRGLMDKLGVKAEMTVSALGVNQAEFLADLSDNVAQLATDTLLPDSDIIFLGAEEREALDQMRVLQDSLARAGAIWVIRPKGSPHISEADVMNAGHAAGLVDTKVVRFSDTHTAEKLVIPKERR
ncbi:MAG: DUF3052 family protein [Dehalococcoidia bacterium]|nr:DUF3052 family protein [Dehalococcoidia bacterium]